MRSRRVPPRPVPYGRDFGPTDGRRRGGGEEVEGAAASQTGERDSEGQCRDRAYEGRRFRSPSRSADVVEAFRETEYPVRENAWWRERT